MEYDYGNPHPMRQPPPKREEFATIDRRPSSSRIVWDGAVAYLEIRDHRSCVIGFMIVFGELRLKNVPNNYGGTDVEAHIEPQTAVAFTRDELVFGELEP